jgi:hypothetical protein
MMGDGLAPGGRRDGLGARLAARSTGGQAIWLLSRAGGCSRTPDRWRYRAPVGVRGSSCSRWFGSTAGWSSIGGACAASMRIVRQRTSDRCAKASGLFFLAATPGDMDPDGGLWARHGLGDRALFVPAGRGSESYRFLDSVDAQTCCPYVAFNLTSTRMSAIPPACQMLPPASRRRNPPIRRPGTAEGHLRGPRFRSHHPL